jgi:predicted metal-dependent enzyme (double-stranded beta helix superfamily)
MGSVVEELVETCAASVAEGDVRGAARDALRRALAKRGEIADALRPERAGLTFLHHTPELTIIHVVWAPGMRIFAHDHRMWAAIGVYTGREDNEFFRRAAPTGGLVPSNGRTLDAGDVIVLGDDTVHAVSNPGAALTAAIHVYGGDFVNEPRSQWRPPTLTEEPYDPAAVARLFEDANASWLGSGG